MYLFSMFSNSVVMTVYDDNKSRYFYTIGIIFDL